MLKGESLEYYFQKFALVREGAKRVLGLIPI